MKSKTTPAGGKAATECPAADWPAAHVEMTAVAGVVPYARNARMHSPEQVRQIAASIREWGWTVPILIDESGGLIAGHGRILAADLLQLERVPAMTARGWTEAQKRAYVIADNQLTLNATWDERMLKVEVEELRGLNFDLELTGLSVDTLGTLLASTDDLAGHEDVAPERPEVPVSRLGDLWMLGRHRLLCGDATDTAAVARLLEGAEPLLMVTDPPYGVNYRPSWRNEAGVSDTERTGEVLNDDRADWSEAWALFPGDVCYVWHAVTHNAEVTRSLADAGFAARAQIVWSKSRFALSRGSYHWQHEGCWYGIRDAEDLAHMSDEAKAAMRTELEEVLAGRVEEAHEYEPSWYAVRRGAKSRWVGGRRQSTLWEIQVTDDGDKTRHGTQKPLECMGRPMRNHDTDAVYDPFVGSGSTLVAAELLDKTCFAMDLDPGYVDAVIARWQKRTSRKAKLGSKCFDAVRKERASP